jgi:hypothetical protein
MTINFRGYVFDDAGNAVSGASVKLLDTGTTTQEGSTDTTDSNGLWNFDAVSETDAPFDVEITKGSSVRRIRWDDQISLKEIDVRNNTGNTTPALTLTNLTNNASNQVGVFSGANSTRADGDEIYLSFKLADSAGNLDEFARITVEATDVTSGSEDGQIRFGVMVAGASTPVDVFTINSTTGGAAEISYEVDSFTIKGGEGEAGVLYLFADQGDDAGDEWKINVADGGVMTIGNDIASAGTYVTFMTLTPHATTASSSVAVVGDLTAGDDFSLTSDSSVFNMGAGNDFTITHDGTTGATLAGNPITITSAAASTWSTSSGALTITAGAALNLNPTSGSAILLDGTISVDAGVVTGATAITSQTIDATTDFTIGSTVITDDSIVMTPSTSDTVTVAAATNGVLNITTVDNAAAAANLNFVVDGAVDVDAAGAINLDSGSGIITFEDSGTEVLRLTEGNSGDVTVKLVTNGKDLVFTDNGDATNMKILDAAAGINVPGEVQTTGIGYTDGDNSMTIADGGKVTFAAGFAVGSDAAGDVLYHNGTSYVRLAKGSDDEVLTLASGVPSWAASSSGAVTAVANGANNYIATFSSSTALNGEANLTFDGTTLTATALAVDDVAVNGKVVTMTGSTSDTAVFTVGTHGTLSIVTTDDAAAAANIQITADGTVDIDSAGILTLDSGAAINIEPASGSAILLDGTISVDAGVVTGATSVTSTAFLGTLDGVVGGNTPAAITGTTIDAETDFTIGDTIITDGVITDSSGLSITAAATVTGTLDAESYAAIGNGSALTDQLTLVIDRDFNATTHARQLEIGGIITTTSGTGNVQGLFVNLGGVVVNSGNTHAYVASMAIGEPAITETSGAVTNAISLWITGAPTEGDNNYALWVDDGSSRFDGQILADGGMLVNSKVQIDQTELVVASGVVTITRGYHSLDTEGGASTDNLDTINGGVDGQILVLRSNNAARDTTLTESGNLKLSSTTMVLDDPKDTIMLIYQGGGNYWQEVSRSNNQG